MKDCYRLLMASRTEKSVKQKNRYDAVLLYMDGYPRKQISELLRIPVRTVSYHILNYEKGGIESLLIVKQPGVRKKLTDKQEAELLSVISTMTPEEAGLGVSANWTAGFACVYVERKFGVTFSTRGMLNLFERLGLSYTRPTYTLDKAEPETMTRDYQTIIKTWFPKGKQRIIPIS